MVFGRSFIVFLFIGFSVYVISIFTKHKLVEDRIRLQSQVIEIMAEGIILIRASDNIIVYTNPGFEQMFGYKPGELVGNYVWVINAPTEKNPQEMAAEISKVLTEKGEWRGEIYNVRKDCTKFWCNVNVKAFQHAEHGKVWISVHTDINERKKAEKALEESEEKYHALMNQAGDAILLVDMNENLLEVNKKAEELLGYTKEELSNMNIAQIHPKEKLERNIATFKESVQKGSAFLNDGTILRKDGKIVHVDITGSSVEYAGKKVILRIFRDITERNRAELEYKTVLNTAMDGFYITDSHGRILDVNDSYCHLIGYSRDELLNMNIKDIQTETKDMIDQRIRRIKDVGWGRFETLHKCKDGRILEIETSVNYFKVGNGKFFVFTRDSTERKQSQSELKESEQKYRSLIENIQDGVFMIQNGKIQFANEAFARISGYTMEEVIRMDFQKFVAPEDLEMVANNYHRRQAGENVLREYEFRILRKDGKKAIVIMNVGLITYQGKVASMGTVKDITERKRAEEKLLESEERYRLLVDFATFGIAIHRDHKFVYANPAAMKMLGATKPEDLIGKPILEIVHPEYHDIVRERIAKQEIGELAPLIEEKFVKLDGTIIDVELISIPFIYKGKQAMYGVFQDISDRKKNLEEIKKSITEKEILLREIHHRVKNNMQIISSLLKLQAGCIEDKKYLEMFKESQNRIMAMSLVHEKLYKSKDFTKINFKDYIHNLANGIFQSYSGRSNNILLNLNIENLELGIDSAVPCGLIINELVTNSIKYAFPGEKKGEIKIVLNKTDENEYELKYSDNGIGIPEDIDIMKTETLGLHLVSMLAEDQLSGKINLDRSKGTEFSIRFGEQK
ncbi:MAG: PAS domain S-box protein [Candidatus Methanoperedens sp.]